MLFIKRLIYLNGDNLIYYYEGNNKWNRFSIPLKWSCKRLKYCKIKYKAGLLNNIQNHSKKLADTAIHYYG